MGGVLYLNIWTLKMFLARLTLLFIIRKSPIAPRHLDFIPKITPTNLLIFQTYSPLFLNSPQQTPEVRFLRPHISFFYRYSIKIIFIFLENLCEFSSSTSQSDDFASLHSTGNHRVSKRPVSKPPKGKLFSKKRFFIF